MMGFFSSKILVSLAPGLASFIDRSDGSLRLIISPLLRTEDREAIELSSASTEEIVHEALEDCIVTENAIAQHTLKCLSWMLRHRTHGNQNCFDEKRALPPKSLAFSRW